MQLAQELIEEPKMSNHAHGLWGYGGRTEDGRDLTIQSIGIGGPSAALVLSQLAGLGVRRAILIGTCRAISSQLSLGDVFVVGEAIGADGVSGELSDEAALTPDPKLGATLAGTAEAAGLASRSVASSDLIGELDERPADDWERRGAEALEMTAAALFAAGATARGRGRGADGGCRRRRRGDLRRGASRGFGPGEQSRPGRIL